MFPHSIGPLLQSHFLGSLYTQGFLLFHTLNPSHSECPELWHSGEVTRFKCATTVPQCVLEHVCLLSPCHKAALLIVSVS